MADDRPDTPDTSDARDSLGPAELGRLIDSIDTRALRVDPDHPVDVADLDSRVGSDQLKEHRDELLASLTGRITESQNMLFAQSHHRVLVVIQAIDTGGKDGTIRHVFGPVNPQGVRIAAFKVPTEPERAHDYLWRVHPHVPGDGEIVLFNRSHYEDVLVVRVHDYVPEARWRRRYDHIRHFEQMLVDEGTTIVKLLLNISADEQAERFRARLDEPDKNWKFSLGDLKERARWDDYMAAFTDMVNETSTPDAPWYVIPADRKWYRNLAVAKIMVETLDRLDLAYPEPEDDLSDVVIT